MKQLITKFDAFGTSIPVYYNNQTISKSTFGGILTLIIYGASLAYAIFKFYELANGMLLPKVITITKAIQHESITLEQNFMILGFDEDDVDPFSEDNNILLPVLYRMEGDEFVDTQVVFSQSILLENEISQQIVLPSLELSLKPMNSKSGNLIQHILIFVPCNSQYYDKCADEQTVYEFMNNIPPILQVIINLRQYNPDTQENELVTKISYQSIEDSSVVYNQIFFKMTHQIKDTGLFTEILSEQKTVNNAEIVSQQITNEFAQEVFYARTLVVFYLRFDGLYTLQKIVDPKLGTILADIGSIVSLLLLSKFVIILINWYIQQNEMVEQMILFYFNDYGDVRVERSLFGQVTRVWLKGQLMSVESFNQFYSFMKKQTKHKLNIMTQLYEMSRLELLLLSTYDRSQIIQALEYNLQLPEHTNESLIYQIDQESHVDNSQQIPLSDIMLFVKQ